MKYTVVVREGNESGFVATVPALPGCVSQGKTRREVLRNIKEAIEVYVVSLLEDGLPVPIQTDSSLVEVQVSVR
jgi:predicted RNase H-like HicB family nuclease